MNPDSHLNRQSQVHLKTEGEILLVILPRMQREAADDGEQIWQDLKYCLKSDDRAWHPGTSVHLVAQDRLLDGRQLQTVAAMLQEVSLSLKSIRTSRRQTAVAAATAGYSVQQEPLTRPLASAAQPSPPPLADPLYLKTTVRSGTTVRHAGTLIILGDVNPGGEVIADGDILIWGTLRGMAHAGANGNLQRCIMALRMEPTQLRLGDRVARVPATNPESFEPEVAYSTKEGIRLSSAVNFGKNQKKL